MKTITKNSREEIRINREEFHGHDVVNIRVFFDGGDGDMRPSRKGLAFRVELLPDVLAALHDLCELEEAA